METTTIPANVPDRSAPGSLAGRVALVTGAVSGIGAAIAETFAAQSAHVIITGRRLAEGEAMAQRLRGDDADVQFVGGDASDEAQVATLIEHCRAVFGRLDIVVNNAGVAPAGPLEDMALEEWNYLLACNLTSMYLVTKHAVPLLRQSPSASIINLGSTFGMVGAGGSAAYAMTKAAAISLSKSLALELAPDRIRVNALCPGATQTEFLDGWAEATGDRAATMQWLVDHHPLGRLGTPQEQADAALFLASDASSFITGHALLVDGGFTAQ
ncbi:SDR family NAD(P)-dependent oxidoreductase [Allobranchiibius sp. GilTou38]|uniref:SDR family NAD(P)-dependent oxidoreductase n=1 Tax=Allobranchiibius sp. GilTou38 TaxID=2815210 RepID=UPI001AA0EA9D|nr:SDR family NAD(P)-dependent oxidoreductase [Allobranchiibius sp. GilTou38]MBO1766747.1 SDR family oxidoreductase [Allobranchiibius sp. GilTou38]